MIAYDCVMVLYDLTKFVGGVIAYLLAHVLERPAPAVARFVVPLLHLHGSQNGDGRDGIQNENFIRHPDHDQTL